MAKKQPERQCAACRAKKLKKDLLRVVRKADGSVVYDPVGKVSGRGVYICKDPECFKKAIKAKVLSRALECEIPDEVISLLQAQTESADG